VADGNVAGSRQTAAGTDRFEAAHAVIAMLPEHNLLKDMTATGGVTGASQQGKDSRVLKTDALHVTFAASTGQSAEKQRIETVESLAPATVQSNSGDEATELHAQRVVAQFDANGHLEKLLGHSGVEVRRQTGKAAPQTSSASELIATFAKGDEWDSLDESGNVHFAQADRRATAAHAKISRATDTIALDGAPEFSDSTSRTTAGSVTINQKSNEIHAIGGVVSTFLSTQPATQGATQVGTQQGAQMGNTINFGSGGSAHISADAVSGSTASGNVVYAGHARLWQGDSVLEADQIQLWRDEKKMQATGHVVAAFPQTAGALDQSFGKQSVAPAKAPSGPVLWTVRAPSLTYWDDQGKAHLEGGVSASSQQGSLTSKALDLFLTPPGTPPGAATGTPTAPAGRQLNRVVAQGNVIVRQGERRGVAEQAEYTAADEKFVLSGGQPTLIDDASSDTTTGRSLTFFVANDTILIDSQEGSRTLTKHRIEK
jgi:lipopolysaccharide export system protein LptA